GLGYVRLGQSSPTLSGGEAQRIKLAEELARPSRGRTLYVLDEPTTGVDAVSRKEFWEMLKELQKKGITILVSTPYMDEAGLCDRVALMQDSRILSIDTPEEIVNRYDKELYSVKSDNMYRLITDLRSFPETGSVFPFGQCVHYTSSTASVNMDGITRFLDDKGHTNVTIEQITPGIEDCFMELMGTGESTERKDG
ncbi:MAG: hypothetical protein KJ607_09035, partial [Bacteroidetes bacterium]|nr:hypothetical protein [Bacteroidota bacterium]